MYWCGPRLLCELLQAHRFLFFLLHVALGIRISYNYDYDGDDDDDE